MDIVLIEWVDAQEETGTLSFEGAKQQNVYPSKTVGFLIDKTKEKVTIASNFFISPKDNKGFQSVWTIPMSCVKKIKKLGKA